MASWVDGFVQHTGDFLPTPEVFRKWAAISALGAILERKVWIDTGQVMYPNVYVFLIGPSGKGKTRVIDVVTTILGKVDGVFFAPTSMSKASMVDVLEESKRKLPFKGPRKEMVEYNTLYIALDELGAFMPEYNADIVNALAKFYDGNWYKEAKRTGHIRHEIDQPNVSILTGSTPTNLMKIFKQDVWGQGLTGRTIMVYSTEVIEHNPLERREHLEPKELLHDIQVINSYYGKMAWTDEYNKLQKAWADDGFKPVPRHPNLGDYINRRRSHLFKLSMISSADRGDDYTLRETDFHRAKAWLIEAEKEMPQIFSAGTTTTDAAAMNEVVAYLQQNGPVEYRLVVRKAGQVMPSYTIDKTLEIMKFTRQIKHIGGNKWVAGDPEEE